MYTNGFHEFSPGEVTKLPQNSPARVALHRIRSGSAQWQAIVFYCGALHLTYTTVRYGSLAVSITLWIFYFHEILFRSGRIRLQWLKKGLTNVLLMLSIALVTLLIFTFVGSFYSASHRSH